MLRIEGWSARFAIAAWLFGAGACGGEVDAGSGDARDAGSCRGASCAGTTPSSPVDAGGEAPDADAAAMIARPMGHPPPASTACAPSGPTAAELGARREVLYSGSRLLRQVSARHTDVLVVDAQQGILRLVADATFERIAAAQVTSFLEGDLHVYWSAGGKILGASRSATDATPTLIASGVPQPIALGAYDQDNLYFFDSGSETLWQQPLAGGAAQMRVAGVIAADMLRLGRDLYYADTKTQQVSRVDVMSAGAAPEVVTGGASSALQALAIEGDESVLYFADDTQIFSTPLDGAPERNPIGQAGPAMLGRGRITRIKRIDDRLYWGDDAGNLGWTATDGSACGLVVRGDGIVPLGWDANAGIVYVAMQGTGATTELWRIVPES